MRSRTITVARRFLGPPNSANGGYVSGRMAAAIEGPAEVTLLRPPPLDTPLALREADDGLALYAGNMRVASARSADPVEWRFEVPEPTLARAAARRSFPPEKHPLPGCFVCGPHRPHGDGLRIHVGPLSAGDTEWEGLLASTWTPDDSLADASERVRPEFVWSALDCPTGYAVSSSRGMRSVLLGRQTVQVLRCPRVGEPCVIGAQASGQDSRKRYAESALFGDSGDVLATCRAIWIEVSPDVQRGAKA